MTGSRTTIWLTSPISPVETWKPFIVRNPHHAGLRARVLAVALCQGAALHYVDGKNGVKDFDVWTFFANDGASPAYPVRRRGEGSFEGSRSRISRGGLTSLDGR